MATFASLGGRLLASGYLILPIKAGDKRPALAQWQSARFNVDDLPRWNGCGVGILTGQGAAPVMAIDIDTLDARVAQATEDYCMRELGPACVRIGQPPKRLLVVRAASAGWTKLTSAWAVDDVLDQRGRVEILGKGQQFVAYGRHPTGRAYQWVDAWGGLETTAADDLPRVSLEALVGVVRAFESAAQALGYRLEAGLGKTRGTAPAAAADPLMTYEPPIGLTTDEAAGMLEGQDASGYENWVRVGMALHHEYQGGAAGLQLWDDWSAGASNYAGREAIEAKWESFGKSAGRRSVTMRSLVHDARKGIVAQVEAGGAGTGAPGSATGKRNGRPRTELGNAQRLVDAYGEGLMHVPELGQWYAWTGVHWRRAHRVEIEHWARLTVQGLPDETEAIQDADERAAHLKWCARSQQWSMIDHMVRLAAADSTVRVEAGALNARRRVLGVRNGMVDLETGRLLEASQEARITRVARVEYHSGARSALWEQTLQDIFWDDAEMVSFFQRLVGYSLLGEPDEDVLVVCWGQGANGKSTALGTIRTALGDYGAMAGAGLFLRDGGAGRGAAADSGEARPDILALAGTRLVLCTEPEEGGELREALIKAMTGGEPLPARALYSGTIVQVVPSWVPWMATNHRPIIRGEDTAIWRRILLLPFTRNFEDDLVVAKDTERERHLRRREDLEGVLAWCVQGARDYLRVGLGVPSQVARSREDYRDDMDLLAGWIAECCEIGRGKSASAAALWASWENWAKPRGEFNYVKSAKMLSRRLQMRGFLRNTTRERSEYVGIGLKLCEIT